MRRESSFHEFRTEFSREVNNPLTEVVLGATPPKPDQEDNGESETILDLPMKDCQTIWRRNAARSSAPKKYLEHALTEADEPPPPRPEHGAFTIALRNSLQLGKRPQSRTAAGEDRADL